jgi:hypothetical protein
MMGDDEVRALQLKSTVEKLGKLIHILYDASAVESAAYFHHVKIHGVHCVL